MASDTLGTPAERWEKLLLSGCFVLSGGVGLIYEVVCGTLLGQIIGGTSTTHAAVLAFFMIGLALGNRYGGRLADKVGTPWLLYGALEGAIGFLVIVALPMVGVAGDVYGALAPEPGSGLGFIDPFLRWGLAAAVIVPVSALMGATLPILVRATTRSLGGLGASVGWLYFVNSVGAVAGALLAGFVLVPRFGLELSLVFTGTVNLCMAAAVYGAGRFVWGEHWEAAKEREDGPIDEGRRYSPDQVKFAVWAVFLSGVAAMSLEVAWTRTLVLTLGGTAPAFSLMLSTFIAGIAFGGLLAAWLARDDRDAYVPLMWMLGIAGASLALAVPHYDRLPFIFHALGFDIPKDIDGYTTFTWLTASVSVGVMAIPTLALGASVPLATRIASCSLAEAGGSVGHVFSINTAGNVIGAILVGVVLLPFVEVEGVFQIAILLLAGGLALTALADKPRGGLLVACLITLASVASPGWEPLAKMSGLYRFLDQDIKGMEGFRSDTAGIKVLYSRDDAEVSVGVIETPGGDRVLRVNGKSDAGTKGDVPTQVLLGQIPALMHPSPRRALVVGLGSGMTVGSLLSHPKMERVDVVEISPAIVEASRLFDRWTGSPLDDPRVHLHVRDVRNLLRVLPADVVYDVIISEPSNPWQPGSAALFALEYFQQLKGRLSKDGVVAQWFPAYELDRDTMDVILGTYGTVFPGSRIFNAVGHDFILISGHAAPAMDFESAERRIEQSQVQAELRRLLKGPGDVTLNALLMHEVVDPRQFRSLWVGPLFAYPLHTDRFPRIQYLAARAFFLGRPSLYLDYVDGRREPLGKSRLLLAERFRLRPPSPEEGDALIRYWKSWPRGAGRALSEDLAQVGRPWPKSEEHDCQAAYKSELKRLRAQASIFSAPSKDQTDKLLQRCADTLSFRHLERLRRVAERSFYRGPPRGEERAR